MKLVIHLILSLILLILHVSASSSELSKDVLGSNRTATNISSQVNASIPVNVKLRELLKMATVTICAVVKDEDLYIDEWLQCNRFLGFDHVHLHDNAHNASTYLTRLPEKYGYYVKVTHSPGLGQQIRSYGKCHAEAKGSNTWTAFIDVDEFIVLRKHANIKAFLRDAAPHGGSVVLKWSIMVSNGTMNYDPAPVVTRFTLTSNAPTEFSKYSKAISYLPHVLQPSVHSCTLKPGHPTVNHTTVNTNHDREVAYINHYSTKSWEEFVKKRGRGFATSVRKKSR